MAVPAAAIFGSLRPLIRLINAFNTLQFLLFFEAEKTRRPYDQHRDEDEKIDCLLVFLSYPVAGENFNYADDKS